MIHALANLRLLITMAHILNQLKYKKLAVYRYAFSYINLILIFLQKNILYSLLHIIDRNFNNLTKIIFFLNNFCHVTFNIYLVNI